MMRWHLSHPLGIYSDREEYQVGRVIVWVEIPPYGSRGAWLERGLGGDPGSTAGSSAEVEGYDPGALESLR
jgi:hypothetical protein